MSTFLLDKVNFSTLSFVFPIDSRCAAIYIIEIEYGYKGYDLWTKNFLSFTAHAFLPFIVVWKKVILEISFIKCRTAVPKILGAIFGLMIWILLKIGRGQIILCLWVKNEAIINFMVLAIISEVYRTTEDSKPRLVFKKINFQFYMHILKTHEVMHVV